MLSFLLMLLAGELPSRETLCASAQFDDLLKCAVAEHEDADRELNKAWKLLRHTDDLVDAQRKWLAWRDSECTSQNAARGGREEPIWHHACMADLTERRTKQLRQDYKWLLKDPDELPN